MAYKYALPGPPFDFLGHMSETQKQTFTEWVKKEAESLPAVQQFHQIRAQQLRKTAGLLEAHYSGDAPPDKLGPTFIKETWAPTNGTHFPYAFRNDHEPAMCVADIKRYFQSHLVHMDDAVFAMNHTRTMIEHHEDQAQHASEAVTRVNSLLDRLDTLFNKPEYEAALVRDQSDTYKGEPRYRVHQLDDPTAWERDTLTGATVQI